MEVARAVSLVAATVTMGLVTGLFYAYACSVMPGLRGVDDRAFVEVMQRINVAILNVWFAIGFVGALLFTGLAALLHLGGDEGGVLQVERWFGLLTDKLIRRGVHTSVKALEDDIRAWINSWNENPRPFIVPLEVII